MASPPEEGTSRSTSARHTGSSPPSVACTSVLRSHAATGASASRPEVAKHCAVATTAPARRAASVTSVTSRLFPTPGLPRTSTTPGRPAAADRQAARSTPTSRARPTKGTAPAGPVSAVDGRASSRRRTACVASSGSTPSSRSRTEAQRW